MVYIELIKTDGNSKILTLPCSNKYLEDSIKDIDIIKFLSPRDLNFELEFETQHIKICNLLNTFLSFNINSGYNLKALNVKLEKIHRLDYSEMLKLWAMIDFDDRHFDNIDDAIKKMDSFTFYEDVWDVKDLEEYVASNNLPPHDLKKESGRTFAFSDWGFLRTN